MESPPVAYPLCPMTATVALQFLLGFVFLVLGAEVLVRGASRLARAMGITPLVVGLTVVAFGTSAPEVAVSVQSALAGKGDLAFGNVVGSNIANILLVLGLSACVAPLVVAVPLVRVDVPIMVMATVLVVNLAWDGTISRPEGVVLLAALTGYVWFTVASSRKAVATAKEGGGGNDDSVPRGAAAMAMNVVLVLAGFGLLVYGSDFLVAAAVTMARAWGVSELVIGLTVVAVGTSLPEVATSVMASFRGERDIAVGNVIGSNIFNLLCVLGAASTLAPGGLPISRAAMNLDVPVMMAASVACLPIFMNGYRIARWEGGIFLFYYVAYAGYLVLESTRHPAREILRDALVFFFLPLTVLTLGVISWRVWQGRGKASGTGV